MRSLAIGLILALTFLLTGCSTSAPTATISDTGRNAPVTPDQPVSKSARDTLLREQKQKLEAISREYENCRDVKDYARMIGLARARRAELDEVIRRIHDLKLPPEEHARILNPLRQERDWHLEVIQAASLM